MRKILFILLTCLPAVFFASSCKKEVDYYLYVSELRYAVYYYAEDGFELKIYCSEKESPYACDGVKGDTGNITEAYYYSPSTPNEVTIEICGRGGEMNYMSVGRNFYLSFAGEPLSGSSVPVKLCVDGKEFSFDAIDVAEEGTIDGRTALKCVTEYDGESFSSLVEGNLFRGEIYVRLLYDGGCYYYVGLCDTAGTTHSYLVDGKDGRIIAEKMGTAPKIK